VGAVVVIRSSEARDLLLQTYYFSKKQIPRYARNDKVRS
jgi:DNA-directed RNA polymerase subunit H (RpoH/RPB5)